LRQDLAGIHDRNPIAVFRLLHEVRSDDDGDALLGQCGDAAPEGAPGQRIRTAGGLIEKQQLRLVQQRRRHCQALFEAARQLSADRAFVPGKLELLQRPGNAGTPRRASKAVGTGEEFEILQNAQRAIQGELLRHVSEPCTRRRGCFPDVRSRDEQLAATGCKQTTEHAKRRRLAGAIGSEQPEDLAAPNLEGDAIDGCEDTELLLEFMDAHHRSIAVARGRPRKRDGLRPLTLGGVTQQYHEAILEARGHGNHRQAPQGIVARWCIVRRRVARRRGVALGIPGGTCRHSGRVDRAAYEAHPSAIGHGIDDIGQVEQPRLQYARRLRLPGLDHETAAGGLLGHVRRRAL